jgi:hypothetical protein
MGAKGTRFMDALMAEHIRLPGVPAFIVTRDQAYSFLLALGHDKHAKGFASIDYLVFGKPPVDEPLSAIDVLDVAEKIRQIEARA